MKQVDPAQLAEIAGAAAALLRAYTELGAPEELRQLRYQLEGQRVEALRLRAESDMLRAELERQQRTIDTLNRRIEWMQSHVKARFG